MLTKTFMNPLRGKTPLVRLCLYCLGVNAVLFLFGSQLDLSSRGALIAYKLGWLAIGIVEVLMIRQCAFNSRYRFLGPILRRATTLSLVLVPFFVYLTITQPEAANTP